LKKSVVKIKDDSKLLLYEKEFFARYFELTLLGFGKLRSAFGTYLNGIKE
jgi:hypothetical protein